MKVSNVPLIGNIEKKEPSFCYRLFDIFFNSPLNIQAQVTNYNFVVSDDTCSSSSCLNNGSCAVNGSTGYFNCTCLRGYLGPRCESK